MAAYLEQFYPSQAELRELCESLQNVAIEEHAPSRADDTNLAITRHPQTGYFEVRSPRCLALILRNIVYFLSSYSLCST